MSYTFNNQYNFADDAQRDAFGRVRVSPVTSLLELKHVYGVQDDLESTVTTTAGSYTSSNSTVDLVLTAPYSGLNTQEYVIRRSFVSAPYQPGKSQIFEASFANLAPEGSAVKRVGAFRSDPGPDYESTFDGFFLECDHRGVISFQVWAAGSQIVNADTSIWLTNDYDPNLIVWSQSQLMMVDYQWLGVGRIRFYMVIDGVPRLFYEYTHANTGLGTYMISPNLPIRYEIRDADGVSGTGGSFTQICAQISTEGSLNSLQKTVTTTEATASLSRNVTHAVLGFRIISTGRGVNAKIKNFSVVQTAGSEFLLQVQRNPALSSNPTWTAVTDTQIEFGARSGLTVISNGDEICSYFGDSTFNNSGPLELKDSAYSAGFDLDGNADEFWICITPLVANGTYVVALNVEYYD